MADNVKKRQSSKRVAAESTPPRKTSRKAKQSGQTVVPVLESLSNKNCENVVDMLSASILPGKPADKIVHVDKPVKAAPVAVNLGLASADVATLLLSLSTQISSLAEEVASTKAELRALPGGVAGVASLAKVFSSPSATVTRADVHAVQDVDGGLAVPASVPSSGVTRRFEGMSAALVTGFSGESAARRQEEVTPAIGYMGESSDTCAGHFRSGGRSVRGTNLGERTEVLVQSAMSQVYGQTVQLSLSPWGQEENSRADSLLDFYSQVGGQLSDCTVVHDGCSDEGAAVVAISTVFALLFMLQVHWHSQLNGYQSTSGSASAFAAVASGCRMV
ncbi:hypothetical protein V1264_015963 [Littorina saxatilis]|uniref:Uncharacterized protein n=1 Tax=Littorina saxatilis TaxID=31220 RepID=A0AAN9BMW3_9CAEN